MSGDWVELTYDQVVRLHERITSFPVRDEGLVRSALDRPWASFGGVEKYQTLAGKAAALLFGLARNHPFVEGNKRTAVGACDLFMYLNGMVARPADDDQVATFVESIARGDVGHDSIVMWVAERYSTRDDST